jgi:hypothetical protein
MKVRNIRASTSETPYKHSAVGLNLAACAGTKLVHFSSEAQGATFVFSGFVMAERGGFEPPVELLTLRRFSKPLLSTTQPPLRF